MSEPPSTVEPTRPQDFIREIVADDLREGRHGRRVNTRFPPEPNGYLHIGHAKSICLNFGVAEEFGGLLQPPLRRHQPDEGRCRVRGLDPGGCPLARVRLGRPPVLRLRLLRADVSYAERLIVEGKAYVDSLTADQIRGYRGSLTSPGRNSPYRDRPVEENLDLFRRMRAGEFPDGAHVLRAKIDMASPNINMRDPTLYRIRHATHHRTHDAWCIYPTYDFAHPISDAMEGITHSLCTLEFEDHRPLYDWVVDSLRPDGGFRSRPQQIEFARLNLNYTVMSKRKLLALVEQDLVRGWDDPRMPTIAGLRRRGYTPEAVRDFCTRIGVAKKENVVDVALLEHTVREDLNRRAQRGLAVLRPLRVEIENYPEGQVEYVEAVNNPEDPGAGVSQDSVLAGALYRSRRLHAGPAEEVLPPVARAMRCVCATRTS